MSLLQCQECHGDIRLGMRFCANCGAQIAAALRDGAPVTLDPASAGGERRFLTVLFCDVVGSTEIASRLDPEETRDLLRAYQAAVHGVVRRYGGYFALNIGDGAVIYFGWPQAHEDDAQRAVRAGLAIIDEVKRLATKSESRDGVELAVRIGIHAGSVVIEPNGEIFGETPNVASRVQGAAMPGGVVVTDAVLKLLGDSVIAEPLGPQRLKGIAEPIALYRVVDPGGNMRRRRRRATLFVNREAELAVLAQAWRDAQTGRGRSVVIRGEAGVGKSRLVQALRELLHLQAARWLEISGAELYARTPFHPVTELLTQRLGLQDTIDTAQRIERLAGALSQARLNPATTLATIAELLSLPMPAGYAPPAASAEQRGHALIETLATWLLNHAREAPTVLLVEDHHWLDASSAELLGRVAAQVDDAPLLVLATERPRGSAFSADTVVSLEQLSAPDITRIVTTILSEEQASPALVERLVQRIGGNPLFAEELAQLMVDRGGRADEHEIPTTLASSLIGRLDALGPAKEVAQVGAMLGLTFSRDTVQEIGGLAASRVDGALVDLVDAGILVRERNRGGDYAFAHALMRDAAYEALLRSRRRELHLKAAVSPRFANHHEIAAYHWERAGEPAKAMAAWHEAGLAASARGGFREAEASYVSALASLARLPQSRERAVEELKLCNLLAAVLQITRGYSAAQTIETQNRVRELTESTGDVHQQMVQTAMDWAVLSSQGRFVESAPLAEQVGELAERAGRHDGLAHAAMIQMTTHYRVGRLADAERSFLRGRAFYDAEGFVGRPGSVAQAFGNAARNAWLMGLADTARERSRYALLAAEQQQRPYDLAFAEYMAGILAVLMRYPEQARAHAERSLALSDEHKFPQLSAISRIVLGRALAELVDAARGCELIEDGMERMNATGARVALTLYHAWLAEAYAFGRRWTEAAMAIDRALTINVEERFFLPECLRVRGEIRHTQGNREGGAADLASSAKTAREMAARACQVRTWLAAFRFGLDPGLALSTQEATALYATLLEGRDTPDMLEMAEWLTVGQRRWEN